MEMPLTSLKNGESGIIKTTDFSVEKRFASIKYEKAGEKRPRSRHA